jgi:iron complex outermembrane receptor protein
LNANSAYAATQVDPIYQYVTRFVQTNDTRTYAAFGNLTFKITDDVSFVGGVRKSEDKRANYGSTVYMFSGNYNWTPTNVLFPIGSPPATPTLIAPFFQHVSWTPWTWDATLSVKPTADILLFARVADGFRSGGFNSAQVSPSPALPYYNPETLRSYELGIKSNLLGNTVEINGTIYHYNYTDMQVTTTFNAVLLTQNAASSKVDGGELEIVARPIPPLELRSNVAYTKSRFTRYQSGTISYAGNPLPQAPKWTATATAAYTIPASPKWDLKPLTSWTYRSQVYYDQTQDPTIGSGTLVEGNVRLALSPHGKGLSIAGFVNNVANKKPVTYAYSFYPAYYNQTFALGRTYGADFTYRW